MRTRCRALHHSHRDRIRFVPPTMLVCAVLAGCTTIEWQDPSNPGGPPIFRYSSSKDMAAEGLVGTVEYHENGTLKSVHVELGSATGNASDVVAEYAKISEAIAEGIVKGMKVAGGIP